MIEISVNEAGVSRNHVNRRRPGHLLRAVRMKAGRIVYRNLWPAGSIMAFINFYRTSIERVNRNQRGDAVAYRRTSIKRWRGGGNVGKEAGNLVRPHAKFTRNNARNRHQV